MPRLVMVKVPPVYSSGLSCFAFAFPTSSFHFFDRPSRLIMLAFCSKVVKGEGNRKNQNRTSRRGLSAACDIVLEVAR